ncbi:MAG: hypothetical protein GF383_09480 [Candidatus Lokiarchaeota archaeon]|nr:hypothetical protein [Candidatus Lokiarchaeota archaeon]MBD3340744.1 hypothetical protein [Candidatus Lokiarchaeota archaeon]
MLKVGIIGTGVIFDLNILGYLNNEDVEITALCNRTVEKAEVKKEKFNLPKDISVYSDYKKMMDEEKLDIVDILLPHHLHADATLYAASKGTKGISVQKPMALSLEEADKMIKACEEAGSVLSIFENFVFDPHIQKAKELLSEGYLGDIASLRIKVAMGAKGGWKTPVSADKWRQDPTQVGGSSKGSPVLFDNGWHAFTLGWWLFEKKIEKVYARTDNFRGIDAPAYVMWKCERDKTKVTPQYGNMEFALMPKMKIPSKYYPTDEFIDIVASRGLMKINQATSLGNSMTNSEVFSPITVVRDGKVEIIDNFELDWKYSFINATKHFIEAVKGNVEPILSGEQARYVLKFNLAAIKSAETGEQVNLKELE